MRKAAPAKAAPTAKKTQPAKKKAQSAPAAKKSAAAKRPAETSKRASAPSKTKPETKPQPKKGAAAAKARPAAKPAARPTRHAPPQPKQPSRDEAAALKAFERAHKEFTRGHFPEARSLFRALIEQHAGVVEVTARARTYLTIAEARMRTEAALPRDPDSLYDRGVIELNRGDFVAAQEMFERALKRDPDAADTHYALAATRARLGSVETAMQALGRAVELKPVLRIRAQADSDFAILRNEPDFERVVFGAPRA
ncbi:MAG TPA: tetratricopeptide repeat protein [Pyrinomonadaceae bacterium]|nr:tetratricopeptide repeat protein [Pyrinomonadaceae bacterium]